MPLVGQQTFWIALTAVASLLYVIVSALLWRASIHANQQAENANKEAQKSFEFTRELSRAIYRPFLAVLPRVEENYGQLVIVVDIENRSQTVQARLTEGRVTADVVGPANLHKVYDFGPASVAPGEKIHVTVGLRTPDPQAAGTAYLLQQITAGNSKLEFEISLRYEGLEGQSYDYFRIIEYMEKTRTVRNKRLPAGEKGGENDSSRFSVG